MHNRFFGLPQNLNDDINESKIPQLEGEDSAVVSQYFWLINQIIEIKQLFSVFQFNRLAMDHFYELFVSDEIVRRDTQNFIENDFIAINALVINFISSGKTLIEAIERFVKTGYGKESVFFKDFKSAVLSKAYDENFPYRFLLHIRNFAQHGHLPVSQNTNKFCFDFTQILETLHININTSLAEEMERIENEIIEKYTDIPRIALVFTLANFNMGVVNVCAEFLDRIKSDIEVVLSCLRSMLNDRTDIIYKSKGDLHGYAICKLSDGSIHSFHPNDDFALTFSEFQAEVHEMLNIEAVELEEIRKNFFSLQSDLK